ncbi:mitochondrial resolvase Ydc2 [Tuber borchii]|uniref:Mitochondrial resolvase Ydc2 n=1 Tax=Tuber borchii TaxID=42251 RepID=A0A2T6ZBZ5_TUBBO|nr:mitochondrial resolvase Ydc2 [Tuber borchii]
MAIPSKSSLLNLKLPQVKFLLKCLGLELSGTKEQMISRVTSHKAAPLDSARRVVSIDMGIRNLAFCFIELPSPGKKLARPKVLAWERICIPPTEAGKTPPGMEIWNDTKVPADDEEDEVNAVEEEEEEKKKKGKKKKEEEAKPEVRRTKMSQFMEELKGLIPGLNPEAQATTKRESRAAGKSVGIGQVATSSGWGQTLSERLKETGKSASMESARGESASDRLENNPVAIKEQSDLDSTSTTTRSSKKRRPENLDELRQILAESLAERDANPPPKPIKESFEPAIFAVHANNFCRSILQRFPPLDAILIEQQRIKSGAGIAVVEWIVHVNRFEAMIHAVLRCLHNEEKISASVESVSPARVMDYWVDGSVKVMSRVRRRTASGEMAYVERKLSGPSRTKLQKIALVSEWVEKGMMFDVAEDLKDITDDFVCPPGVKRKIPKLDDLADCLLQGLAWAEWQDNRRKFAEGTLLDELEISTEK